MLPFVTILPRKPCSFINLTIGTSKLTLTRMTKTIVLRFLRGFVAGGIANLAAILAASQFDLHSLADLQALAYLLGIAFLTGGIMALDKMLRYEPSSEESIQ